MGSYGEPKTDLPPLSKTCKSGGKVTPWPKDLPDDADQFVGKLRQSELHNARAVKACQRAYQETTNVWSQ